MQSCRLNGIPWGMVYRNGQCRPFRREGGGKILLQLIFLVQGDFDRANSPSALIRIDAREKPTLRINQSNRSIRRACDRFDEPPSPPPNHSTVGYGVLYHWILFEPPTVHLKFPIFSTIKPERFFAKLKFSRNEHIVFASFHNFLMYNISSKIAVLYAAPNVRVDEK